MSKGLISCTLLLLWSTTGCTVVQEGATPNATPLQALKKIFLAPLVIQGIFHSQQKSDYYAVKILQKGYYTLSLSAVKGADLKLSILRNTTLPLTVADDHYQNQGESLPAIYLEKNLYYLRVDHKEDIPPVFHNNRAEQYTILLQRFIPTIASPAQWDHGTLPELSSVQEILPAIPLYGYFSPYNGKFITSLLINNFISHAKISGDFHLKTPYHFSFYTFVAPTKPSKADITLSGLYSNAVLMICSLSDFIALSHEKLPITPPESKQIRVSNGHDPKETENIRDYMLIPQQRYILVVIGFSTTEINSSFSSVNESAYQLLLNIEQDSP